MKVPNALIISRAPRMGSRPDLCDHVIDPRKRFTEPGVWPQVAHCNACGATVHLAEPGGQWAIATRAVEEETPRARFTYGKYRSMKPSNAWGE